MLKLCARGQGGIAGRAGGAETHLLVTGMLAAETRRSRKRGKARSVAQNSARCSVRPKKALLTWLTSVPPDRVGVARLLRLGDTLKPTAAGFELDLRTPDAHNVGDHGRALRAPPCRPALCRPALQGWHSRALCDHPVTTLPFPVGEGGAWGWSYFRRGSGRSRGVCRALVGLVPGASKKLRN